MRQTLLSGLTHTTIIRISVLVLLSMADYVLTCYAINSGIGSEANPLLSWTSLEGIGLAKTVGLVMLIYRYWNKPKILYPVAGVLMSIVCWNIYVIL